MVDLTIVIPSSFATLNFSEPTDSAIKRETCVVKCGEYILELLKQIYPPSSDTRRTISSLSEHPVEDATIPESRRDDIFNLPLV